MDHESEKPHGPESRNNLPINIHQPSLLERLLPTTPNNQRMKTCPHKVTDINIMDNIRGIPMPSPLSLRRLVFLELTRLRLVPENQVVTRGRVTGVRVRAFS